MEEKRRRDAQQVRLEEISNSANHRKSYGDIKAVEAYKWRLNSKRQPNHKTDAGLEAHNALDRAQAMSLSPTQLRQVQTQSKGN